MRFALLVVLLLISSATMMLDVVVGFSGANDGDGNGCLLAAGADPFHDNDVVTFTHAVAQINAMDTCITRYEAPPPWWLTVAWPVLVLVLAGVLFRGLPAWKARRRRVVPLWTTDHDGEIQRTVNGAAAKIGLARTPRVVVDRAEMSASAVVFGRNRRPTVCLHGGLLARHRTDPGHFEAVLLHELAHIRNGDVTITYITVAVWRTFIASILLPYLAWNITEIVTGHRLVDWPIQAPGVVRNFVCTVFLVALIHLARADVLRSREIYADRTAVGSGADPHGWAVANLRPAGGPLRRASGSFVGLWHLHPSWDLRRKSLTDPAVLFGVPMLPMFLVGAAATLISSQSWAGLSQYRLDGQWVAEAVALATAALVTAVVGVTLWRAVMHAMVATRPVRSGALAGLWLGAGMAAAELLTSEVATHQWLPGRPELLLLPVLAGAMLTWWTTACAHLWPPHGRDERSARSCC